MLPLVCLRHRLRSSVLSTTTSLVILVQPVVSCFSLKQTLNNSLYQNTQLLCLGAFTISTGTPSLSNRPGLSIIMGSPGVVGTMETEWVMRNGCTSGPYRRLGALHLCLSQKNQNIRSGGIFALL